MRGIGNLALGQLYGALGELVLRLGHGLDGRVHQLHVDGHAPVVDGLVKLPQRRLGEGHVDHGHEPHHFAHGLDVRSRVGLEALPLHRVRFAGSPAQDAVLAQRFGKELDQALAVLVLGLVRGQAQYLAEHAQGTRQAVAQGLDHGVVDAAGGDVDAPRMPDNRAVEVAVVDHYPDIRVGKGIAQRQSRCGDCRVIYLHRLVVPRIGYQQYLRVRRVGVRAVGNRGLGVRLQVQI